MPGYKGHLIGGAVAFAVALCVVHSAGVYFNETQGLQWFASTLAGSLFPDIDVKSKGQNIFYKIILCLLLFMLFYDYHRPFITISVAAMVPMIVRHRGIFHRLWFVISFPVVLALFLVTFYPLYQSTIMYNSLFFMIGAISHLWLDLGFKRMIRF
jgi:hypothetical protein